MKTQRPTRIKPAPLAFPNGGGLAAMASQSNKIKTQEIRVAEEQHKLNLAKIEEKHKPKPTTVRAKTRG